MTVILIQLALVITLGTGSVMAGALRASTHGVTSSAAAVTAATGKIQPTSLGQASNTTSTIGTSNASSSSKQNPWLPALFGLLGTLVGAFFTFFGTKATMKSQRSIAVTQMADANRVRQQQQVRDVRQAILSRQQSLLEDLQGALEAVAVTIFAVVRQRESAQSPLSEDLANRVEETYMAAFKLTQRLPHEPLATGEDSLWDDVDRALGEEREGVLDAAIASDRAQALQTFRATVKVAQERLGARFEQLDQQRLLELAQTSDTNERPNPERRGPLRRSPTTDRTARSRSTQPD